MNKKQGFTLIELLAVIVVLAIIALIATPIVMNTIKRSKKGAAERSADSYVKQVEVAVATERLNKNEVLDGEYQITNDGNLCRDKSASCSDEEKIKIEMSGTKPSSGKIKITNGSVDQSSSNMTIGDYTVSYNSTKKTYEATEKGGSTEVLCTANQSKVSASVYNDSTNTSSTQEVGLLASESGAYTPGVTYTCELGDNESKIFFVLETNGDKVSLIMDKNIDSTGKGTTTGNTVAWSSDGDNHIDEDASAQAVTAKEYLKNSTTSWTKLIESQISLPTGQQIATAGGDSAWTDSKEGTTLSTWLYGNLYVNESAPYGYWTSSPRASYTFLAWNVFYFGCLSDNDVNRGSFGGVRPVITVAKSQLN